MDDQQRQRIDGAAREFSGALVAAYRTTSVGTAAAQHLGAQQIEYFFNTVMNNLRTQSEGALHVTQQLAAQQELARDATRELTRVSTDNYMDFLDSAFSFYHGGSSRTQRRAEEARRRVEGAEARAEEAEKGRSEAERQAEQAKKSAEEAQERAKEAETRAEEAEKRVRSAQRRAQKAEKSAEEAEERVGEAQSRAEEAERRAEEAERSRGEAEGRSGGQEEEEDGAVDGDAGSRSQSIWVRTSGRSRVRGRNPRSRGRSSGRR
jgi:chromosome segregation ATPase